ncbi:MAG: cell division protein CrgA [Actinomycetia bacterium]|nr:cell division protein CrgA [Actinomycetes bacterium]MCP4959607.1 cell division protein CrgA [Actinomycetes bacterium]
MSRSFNKPGRVTQKGTRPAGYDYEVGHRPAAAPPSPRWLPATMGTCLAVGVAVIFANYLSWLPGSPDTWWLLGGLGFVLVGIMLATRWR